MAFFKETANDFRVESDKNITKAADSKVAQILEEYKKATKNGAYEYECPVPKIIVKKVVANLKASKFAVVTKDEKGKTLVKAYWGPTKKAELGDTRTPQQWFRDQMTQGYKKA